MGGILVHLGQAVPTTTMAAAYIAAALILYQLLVWAYQISPFHPLAHIPGPKIARVGRLYEAYWDWLCDGRYMHKVAEMHARYGPIVRIGHDEVHCSDPYFANTLYGSQSQVRDKPQHLCNTLVSGALPHTAIVTGPQALHRARRAPMSRFFSRAQVFRFEDEVHRLALMVVDKMLLSDRRGKSFNVRDAFNCFTADVVFLHALGRPLGFVEMQEAWTPNLATWTEMITDMVYLIKHNAWARWAATVTPTLAGLFSTNVRALNELMNVTIPDLLKSAADDVQNDRMFPILLRGGMDTKSEAAPGVEMDMFRLGGEAMVLLTAGTETTSAALAIITYHILARPEVKAALTADLAGLDPTALKWTELERRPYLWALIHEALRHSPPIVARSSRVAPLEDLVYIPRGGHGSAAEATPLTIPRGFTIGMSTITTHYDPTIFQDPSEFRPERWLVRDSDGNMTGTNEELKKFLLTFGRGSRACIGENLAMCELFIMTAMMALCVLPRARLDDRMTADYVTYDHEKITLQTIYGNVATHIVVS
ncbi:hypothetical protein PpBr36_04897 [Pyricularia pennisetigena]|uniref:hypothetical protein n=1 Tax=Pyricularia pennisetigena TaxID=1578925 RepID=UPI00114D8C93|nr:hypothetical protein PpBr36_04897 [Pyricularia pennisetigena]TLS26271.1 hypothetical protein PpBr36_04897 [Pyricularia pennisetigena]